VSQRGGLWQGLTAPPYDAGAHPKQKPAFYTLTMAATLANPAWPEALTGWWLALHHRSRWLNAPPDNPTQRIHSLPCCDPGMKWTAGEGCSDCAPTSCLGRAQHRQSTSRLAQFISAKNEGILTAPDPQPIS